jgi:hypothetical protein
MEASRRSASGSLPAAAGVLAAAWRAANGETDATAPTPPPRDAASWQALQAARASIDRARSISPPVGDDVAVREEWSRPRSTRMAEFADGFVPEPAAEPVDDAPPLLLPHAQPPSPLGPHGSAALQGGIPGGVHLAVARISERRPDPKTIGLQPPQAQQQAPASPTAPRSSAAPAVATPQSAARSFTEAAEDSGVPADVAACFAAFHAAGDGADALRLRAAGSDAGFVYSAFGFLVSAEDTLTKCAVALHAQRGWTARAHTALDADEEDNDDDDEDDATKTPAHNKLLWQLPLERLEAAWWSLDAEDDELMLLDAAGSGGDARLLLPARDVAVGALASLVARRGAALAAADTSDDPRKPWLGDRGPGGRQLLLLPPSDGDDDGKEDEEDTQPAASPLSPASPKVATAPAEESGSDEASTSDDGSSDDAGPRRRQWSGSGLRRSGS